jgi:hypothetical protein
MSNNVIYKKTSQFGIESCRKFREKREMAMNKMAKAQAEMKTKLNLSGKVVESTQSSPSEDQVSIKKERYFNKQKRGTVIPAKRKLVKRMMYECVVQPVDHAVHPGPPSSPSAPQSNKPDCCFQMCKPI